MKTIVSKVVLGMVLILTAAPFESWAGVSEDRARELMGNNFFGIGRAIIYFKVHPTDKQRAALAEVPFSEATLRQCRPTHILVAVFPLSILEIRGRVDPYPAYDYEMASWCNEQEFMQSPGEEASWQLVRKTPVPKSLYKEWDEQEDLIGRHCKVPTAQVMIYAIVGHWLATGECLFGTTYVRTSSFCSDGRRVVVGHFYGGGPYVSVRWDDYRRDYLGLASIQK